MRYVLSRRDVPVSRIILIESGSRAIVEGLLPPLRASWARDVPVDLLTCYGGVPAGLDRDAFVYRVADYATSDSRKELIRQLRSRRYNIAGIVCSGEPIMTKWKWLVVLRLPVKVFVINENGDYFWINREQTRNIREFCFVRMGLEGEGSIRTLGRLIAFPFSLMFLLMYAFAAHAGRLIRLALHSEKL